MYIFLYIHILLLLLSKCAAARNPPPCSLKGDIHISFIFEGQVIQLGGVVFIHGFCALVLTMLNDDGTVSGNSV